MCVLAEGMTRDPGCLRRRLGAEPEFLEGGAGERMRSPVFPLALLRVRSDAQSCPTLCDPVDCSLPGSPVHGIFQAGILEWAAISSSRGSS